MFGFGKKKSGDNQREHERIATKGEEVRIYGETYDLGDLSEGGSYPSQEGVAGTWTINVVFDNVSGTVNFRAEAM